MTYIEIVLLAISLCFDTLAVSMAQASTNTELDFQDRLNIELTFGFVQALFIFAGWLLGSSFLTYIEKADHWIAFILLGFIGGKMMLESFKPEDKQDGAALLSFKNRVLAAVATSIDALAVGVSLAMTIGLLWQKIIISTVTVGFVTAITAAIGLKGGELLSRFIGGKSSFVGGLILIAIGVKILLEHLLV